MWILTPAMAESDVFLVYTAVGLYQLRQFSSDMQHPIWKLGWRHPAKWMRLLTGRQPRIHGFVADLMVRYRSTVFAFPKAGCEEVAS